MPPHNPKPKKKSAFGWACRACSLWHEAPADRCAMCGNLRGATRQEMHDFVLGKKVAPMVEGNCVELLDSPDKTAAATTTVTKQTQATRNNNDDAASKENRHNHRAPPSLPKPSSTVAKPATNNPYFKPGGGANNRSNNHGANPSNRGVVRNPYSVGRPKQQQQQQHRQQPQQRNNDSTTIQQQRQQPPPAQSKAPPTEKTNQGTANPSAPPAKPPQQHPFFDKAANAKKRKPRESVHRFAFSPGPVPHDPDRALTYIYPKHPDYPTREYQLEITESALNHNTLVSLPTGLGKTHIAAVVMYNYYRWFSSKTGNASQSGKVIFLAPTLPLVNQQIEACYDITGIPGHETAVMTGKLKAAERMELWKSKRVFYCTPQTVQRDLLGACGTPNQDANAPEPETDPETAMAFSRVVCLVLDEAHKATGDYAYTKVVELLEKAAGAKFRILGLSATPGTTIKAIQGVIDTLRSCKIEARTDSDRSVAPYLHQKETEIVVCERNTTQREVNRKLSAMLHPLLQRLREEGGLQTYGNDTLPPYTILLAKQKYDKRPHSRGAVSACFSAARKLAQIRSDCHQGLGIVKTKLLGLKNTPQRGILSTVVKSDAFADLLQLVLDKTGNGNGCEDVTDPKLAKLCEVLKIHFQRKNACNLSSRAIVFAQLRDSVDEIVKCLEKNLKPLVRSRYFVGQSNNNGKADQNVQGMTQAEQQRAIKDFRNNVYNVLVCTSIGEEGLDIGEVDLIVQYDAVSSPIRTIQRAGRTGRKREGRVVSLVSEGNEETTHRKRVGAEKTLVNALKNPKKFRMANHYPMLPIAPEKEYRVMEVREKLSLSEVAGAQHTPGASKRSEAERKKVWRLNATEEYERQTLCGEALVSLDESVSWERLKVFFCKNRVDPTKLPGSRTANRRLLSLGRDNRERLLRKRNKIRQKRRGNRSRGRIQGILESLKPRGSIYSEGTTRSGHRDILSIFPVDPVEGNRKPKPTRVNKKLWEDTASIGSKHVASTDAFVGAPVASESRPTTDSRKEADAVALSPRPILERKKAPFATSADLNASRSRPTVLGAEKIPDGDSRLDERPMTEISEIPNDACERAKYDDKAGMGAVDPTGQPLGRELPISKIPSSTAPPHPDSETAAFRLPTPPPSSDDDSSVASERKEKGTFRLPTPPPSSDSSSEEDEDAGDSDDEAESKPSVLVAPEIPHDDEIEVSNVNETEVTLLRDDFNGGGLQQKPSEGQASLPHLSEGNKEKVIFRLPTPPPSSSSSSSDGDDIDDSDTITIPEPKAIPDAASGKSTGHDPDVVNLENCKFKPTETEVAVDYVSNQASSTPEDKLSIGFDGQNDLALSSLKNKPSTGAKNVNSGKVEHGDDESEEDILLISFSNKKKRKSNPAKKKLVENNSLVSVREKKRKKQTPLGNNNVAKGVLPRVSFGKSPLTKKINNGNESEEDVPLITFSGKKKSNQSQKLANDIPLIALWEKKCKTAGALQEDDVGGKQGQPLISSGKSPIFEKTGNEKSAREINKDDETLVSLKNGRSSNDTLREQSITEDFLPKTSNRPCVDKNEELEQKSTAKEQKHPETPDSNNRFKKDWALTSTQSTGQSEKSDVLKIGKTSVRLPRIMETPDSQSVQFNFDLESTQVQSQNEIIDHSKYGKNCKKRPRILETPDSTNPRSQTEFIEPSQSEVLNHSEKCNLNKRLRIGSEDSGKVSVGRENDHSIDVTETQQSHSNSTPPTSFFQPTAGILENTPQSATRKWASGEEKENSSNFLTDTPNNAAFNGITKDIVCEVCASGDSTEADPIVFCDACNLGFHKNCYQIDVDIESEEPWYCDACINRSRKGQLAIASAAIACTYCCQRNGALRNDGRTWYHPLCSAFASKITAASCDACSLVGAVQCNHSGCSSSIHPHCAPSHGWTIVRTSSEKTKLFEYSIFCPKHIDSASQSPSAHVRIIRKSSSAKEKYLIGNESPRPKKIQKKIAKATSKASTRTDGKSESTSKDEIVLLDDSDDEKESPRSKRERLREQRRKGMAKYVLEEAEIRSDQERDDADEEEELRRIEEEEEGYSQDSFINDNEVLSQHFSQDNLRGVDPDASSIGGVGRLDETPAKSHSMNQDSHRALDALRERENQFRTPSFNRRMMRPDSSSTPSSAQGLGNMNFIRSVLEHHRQGGDCDQIEAEYKRLEGTSAVATSNAPIDTNPLLERTPTTTAPNPNHNNACVDLTTPPEDNGASSRPRDTNTDNSSHGNANGAFRRDEIGRQSNRIHSQPLPPRPPPSGGLTADQLARIEANRQAALRRRAELLAKKQENRDPTSK